MAEDSVNPKSIKDAFKCKETNLKSLCLLLMHQLESTGNVEAKTDIATKKII